MSIHSMCLTDPVGLIILNNFQPLKYQHDIQSCGESHFNFQMICAQITIGKLFSWEIISLSSCQIE